MKKIKTNPVVAKVDRNEDTKVSSYEKNNSGKTPRVISESRRDSKQSVTPNPAGQKPNASAASKPQDIIKSGAGERCNDDGARHSKDKEEKSQPLSLPEQLDTAMATSQAGEEDDSVRSSIVSQILASVRGETSPSSPVFGASSASRGDKQSRKSPPPVAARVHKSKPHSSSGSHQQAAKPKQVQINTSRNVLGDSERSFSGDSSRVLGYPKPSKPPRANTGGFLPDKPSLEKVESVKHSVLKYNEAASVLASSNLGVHKGVSSKSEPLPLPQSVSRAGLSSHANLTTTKEQQTKQTQSISRSPSSNTCGLSTSTSTSAINGKNEINNDKAVNDIRDLNSQQLDKQRTKDVGPLIDNSSKTGGSIDNSKTGATRETASPTICKSGEIIEPSGQSICRVGEANQPLSVTANGLSTSEFPQSLSADSGIGSPTTYSCTTGKEREREGLYLNTFPDKTSLDTADNDTNQITPSPITSPDCLAPSVVNSDSNYLQVPESSLGQRTAGNAAELNTPSTEHSSGTEEAGSQKQSQNTLSDNSRTKTLEGVIPSPLDPPSPQTIERTTQNATDRLNGDEGTSLSHSSPISPNPPHASHNDEQNSAKNSNLADIANGNKGQDLDRTPESVISVASGDNVTQESSTDNQRSNGESDKQDEGPVDAEPTNNNGSIKKKSLLFVDQPEFVKPGLAGLNNKRKPSFKDVCLYDVILMSTSPNSDRKIKGILKTSNSSPALVQGKNQVNINPEPINGVGFRPGKLTKTTSDSGAASRCVSFKNTHTKNTFSYHNAAFEGEIITEPSKRPSLADVVSHIMRQNSIVDVVDDDNSHPYGRDSSLTDLMTGKRRDRYSINAGKLIVWLTLAVMIVSLAAGIIFMSETYNLKHPDGPPTGTPALYQG